MIMRRMNTRSSSVTSSEMLQRFMISSTLREVSAWEMSGSTMKRATGVSNGMSLGCRVGLMTRIGTKLSALGQTKAGATRTPKSSTRESSRGRTQRV